MSCLSNGPSFRSQSRRPSARGRCESHQMENEIPANPAYRRVVADLRDCEERYAVLEQSLSATADSAVSPALTAIKNEVRQRRQLEADLLTAIEGERQRIGQDLHDDLCQRLGARGMLASLSNPSMTTLSRSQLDFCVRCVRQASKPCAPKASRPREPVTEFALAG
jgi:signal transduction histidine kinase